MFPSVPLLFASVLLVSRAHGLEGRCQPPFERRPFCNSSLPYDQRVADLLATLSLDDKLGLLTNGVRFLARISAPSSLSPPDFTLAGRVGALGRATCLRVVE